jgi:uncharacterized protein YndB with AHSA1/START domain
MSYRIEASVTINAPAEAIWPVIQDLDRRLQWDARVVSVERMTPLPLGKGTTTRLGYRIFGRLAYTQVEYVSWKPPYQCGVRSEMEDGSVSGAGSWNFKPQPDGSTRWTTRIVLNAKSTRFRTPIEYLFGYSMERLTRISQQNLKKLVEAEYKIPTAMQHQELIG